MLKTMTDFVNNFGQTMQKVVDKLKELYDGIDAKEKSDIDNLLKSESFSNKYLEIAEIKNAKNSINE